MLLIIMIVLSSAAGGMMVPEERYDLALLALLATIVLVIFLLADIRRGGKSVTRFFESVLSGDFSTTFDESDRDPFIRTLHERMNRLIRKFRDLRVRSESRETYYRAVLQQSATGLVVLNAQDEIVVINRAAARFAGISPDSTDKRLMKIRNPHFFEQLTHLSPGEKRTYRDHGPGPSSAFLLRAIELDLSGERLKVISIENIRRELDQTELESYQRLIRVLTHEIMNSVAPLTSVSGTLQKRFFPDHSPIDPSGVNDDLIRGLIQGLSTIDDQTRGMVEFVNNYRKLTKLPEPVLGQIEVTGWIEKIGILITDQLQEAGVRLSFSVDPGISIIHADPRLLNQVILNLVNNAIDAMRENQGKKELSISLFRVDPEHVYIRVSNNGAPIPEEELEKIFIPFYTTKEHGSGIGLYLSRQIIHQHGGLLSVSSRSGETSFLIELPEPADEYPGHTRMSTPANPG